VGEAVSPRRRAAQSTEALKLREALSDIAGYTLPTWKIERDGKAVEVVDFEFADQLRTMAQDALKEDA
jgi:hypothetical protein